MKVCVWRKVNRIHMRRIMHSNCLMVFHRRLMLVCTRVPSLVPLMCLAPYPTKKRYRHTWYYRCICVFVCICVCLNILCTDEDVLVHRFMQSEWNKEKRKKRRRWKKGRDESGKRKEYKRWLMKRAAANYLFCAFFVTRAY